MPSEESKQTAIMVSALWRHTSEGLIDAIALALDEAKAERTEECARIADAIAAGLEVVEGLNPDQANESLSCALEVRRTAKAIRNIGAPIPTPPRLTRTQFSLLNDACNDETGSYCGFSPKVLGAAKTLERFGLGHVSSGDLGPIFFASEAGYVAHKSLTQKDTPHNAE